VDLTARTPGGSSGGDEVLVAMGCVPAGSLSDVVVHFRNAFVLRHRRFQTHVETQLRRGKT
jgi:hypothetical protein